MSEGGGGYLLGHETIERMAMLRRLTSLDNIGLFKRGVPLIQNRA